MNTVFFAWAREFPVPLVYNEFDEDSPYTLEHMKTRAIKALKLDPANRDDMNLAVVHHQREPALLSTGSFSDCPKVLAYIKEHWNDGVFVVFDWPGRVPVVVYDAKQTLEGTVLLNYTGNESFSEWALGHSLVGEWSVACPLHVESRPAGQDRLQMSELLSSLKVDHTPALSL